MVEQQQRPGRVRFQPTRRNVGLQVQHDPLVAEADPEVLKAPVSASGLRQHVVELITEHRRDVTS